MYTKTKYLVVTMRSRDFGTLPHKSPNVHAVFEIDPEICTRIQCAAAEPFANVFCVFFRWKCGIP